MFHILLDVRELLAGIHTRMHGGEVSELVAGIDRDADTPSPQYIFDCIALKQESDEAVAAALERGTS